MEILKICKQKLNYLNYSDNTINIYCHYIEKFLNDIRKPHQHLVSKDFERYITTYKYSSRSQQNQIINALKFLYEKGLNKKYLKVSFERPRKEKHLPQPIDKSYLLFAITSVWDLV